MQDATPQGEPRLQYSKPGPATTTGFVDPCIVFLETTLTGEIPLVAACWARSSREVREPGRQVRLELTDVLVFEGRRYRFGWSTARRRAESLTLKYGLADATPGCSYFSFHQTSPPPVFQWAVRYLDRETDATLRKQADVAFSPNARRSSMTRHVFELARLDWHSVGELIASEEKLERLRTPKPRNPQPSLLRRFLSSLFKKKPKLAHA